VPVRVEPEVVAVGEVDVADVVDFVDGNWKNGRKMGDLNLTEWQQLTFSTNGSN
jgi:hypothetical protein